MHTDAKSFQLMSTDARGHGKLKLGRFQLFLGRFRHFSAILSRTLAENQLFLIFQIWQMSNIIIFGKILKRASTMRAPMLNRGPLVRPNCDTVLKNVTNVIGEADPEED